MNKAKVVEIGPRDGFQNVKEIIPTEVKMHIIDGIIDAGFKKVQIGSFVSPRAIPQMADFRNLAEQVLTKYGDSDVEFFALVPNLKGAELAAQVGLKEVTPVMSLTESHNMNNVKKTREESLGRSRGIRTAVRMARKYANSGATVMIHGETGTGKEMFAQSIHNASARASGPFVAVNCGSLPKDILEAELFGYVEGAFTGALKGGKTGLFEMAHGGTIFLDEIGEMPLQTQVQMLRVLQEKEIRRVGSDKVTPIDIRVVAATHRDLSEAVRRGEFREDLYYRLNILNLEIPPLRERGEDLMEIGLSVYASFGEHEAEDEEKIREILTGLSDYAWPGNIRELSNMMERFYVLRSQGEDFDFIRSLRGPSGGLREEKRAEREDAVCGVSPESVTGSEFLPGAGRTTFEKIRLSKTDSRQEKERREILDALGKNDMEITRTAQALSMSRSTLWRKMKKYGISIT